MNAGLPSAAGRHRRDGPIFCYALLFWVYSPYALVLTLGLLLYTLKQSWKSPKFWGTLTLSAPIGLYQLSYVNSLFMTRWVSRGDLGIIQETTQFLLNPVIFLLNGFGLNISFLALIPYTLSKWKQQTLFTKTMLLTFASMLIVWPIWFQRTFSLIIIPTAYITALYVLKVKNKYARATLLSALIIQALLFSLFPVWWMSPINWLNKYW